jgi:hypothetical protein
VQSVYACLDGAGNVAGTLHVFTRTLHLRLPGGASASDGAPFVNGRCALNVYLDGNVRRRGGGGGGWLEATVRGRMRAHAMRPSAAAPRHSIPPPRADFPSLQFEVPYASPTPLRDPATRAVNGMQWTLFYLQFAFRGHQGIEVACAWRPFLFSILPSDTYNHAQVRLPTAGMHSRLARPLRAPSTPRPPSHPAPHGLGAQGSSHTSRSRCPSVMPPPPPHSRRRSPLH